MYVGPYCVDYTYIYLGAFYDEQCTFKADSEAFQAQNYGDGFPYFDEAILSGKECLACIAVGAGDNGNNNNGNNGNEEANALCEKSLEEGIKCDSKRGYSSGCTFLKTTLPCLDGRNDCTVKEETGNNNSDFTSELYQEMARQIQKNKRAAFAMGAIAGGLLFAMLGMCLWCCCRPSLLQSSKRNPLLQRRLKGTVVPTETAPPTQ